MTQPYQTVAPTTQPLHRDEVKRHCNIDHAQDDTVIDGLIQAATSYFDGRDGILGRALITQTWARNVSSFPYQLRLPIGPVASVSSISYYDQDGAQQTLGTSVYELRRDDLGAYVTTQWQQTWPYYTPRSDGIVVTWVAGTAAAAIPKAIRQALLMLVAHWYENRETAVIGVTAMDVPFTVKALIAPFRRREVYYGEEAEWRCPSWP